MRASLAKPFGPVIRMIGDCARWARSKLAKRMEQLRVLLVEDEPRMSKLVSRALARAGFIVDAFSTCADGREAISLFHYDAAILDLGLPDGDGLTLLAARRSSGHSIP